MPATALFRVATGRRHQTWSLPTQGLSDEGQEGLGSINISVSLFQTRVSFVSLGFLQFSVQVGFLDNCNSLATDLPASGVLPTASASSL